MPEIGLKAIAAALDCDVGKLRDEGMLKLPLIPQMFAVAFCVRQVFEHACPMLNRHPRRRRRRPASSCLALRDATTIFLITRLNDDRSLAVRRLAAFGASSWTTLR